MYPPLCAYCVLGTEQLEKQIVLFFSAVVDGLFCSCRTSIGVTSLERLCFIGQHILFQTWTTAAVTHVKMEALALTAYKSTVASALGTRERTVKQVREAVLIYLLKYSFVVSSCICCGRCSCICRLSMQLG